MNSTTITAAALLTVCAVGALASAGVLAHVLHSIQEAAYPTCATYSGICDPRDVRVAGLAFLTGMASLGAACLTIGWWQLARTRKR